MKTSSKSTAAEPSIIDEAIVIDAPAQAVYDQWTQFEEFPRIFERVEKVEQLDDRTLRWVAVKAGQRKETNIEIVEQIPGKRIAWRNISGARNAGVVTFHRLDEGRCRVMVQLQVEPDGVIESIGKALGSERRGLRRDLEQLKSFIEARGGEPTGAWRGVIPSPDDR